ncbi:hypothetical protein [Paenibacillus tengchongensis]|uniref:hypothetical protein n=1 Tax=Paenibacillus tengchongensis TaxID=2608684 RepID=UPI00124DDED4|nr:hypothetical protein [Paenibacillus tengchongensis]
MKRGAAGRRNIIKRAEGSVSVFLISALAFVFLFTAVLIDYARIAAANVQEERLARAAVRSVMSSFDNELFNRYGLFAFGGENGDELLAEALNGNLYESGRGDAFNLLPVKLDSSALAFSRPIGTYDIFRKEIMEEMKYKAPVDFALELARKFKPLSVAMGEASRTAKVLAKLQPLYDEREAALDVMLERRKQAAESGRQLQALIMNPPADAIASRGIGAISSTADIVAMHSDYAGKYYSDLYREKDTPNRYGEVVNSYMNQTAGLLGRLPGALSAFATGHERLLSEAEAAYDQTVKLNGQMAVLLEQSRNNTTSGPAGGSRDWDIPGSTGEMGSEPLRQIREQEEQLILSRSELESMSKDLSAQSAEAQAIQPVIAALPEALAGAAGADADISLMYHAVLQASNSLSGYILEYGDGGTVITLQAERVTSRRTSDGQRKQLEQQAKVKLGDAANVLNRMQALGDSAEQAMKRFSTLRQYYQEIVAFNEGTDRAAEAAEEIAADPYTAGNASMVKADGVYSAISGIMEGARDRVFQSEYAALYFPHMDLSQLGLFTSGVSAGSLEEGSVLQLDPHAQELEYILYGFHNPAGNVAAAFGEIFALRLAIRTMEGLIDNAKLGHPLAILAAALLYGAGQALQDMALLCKNGAIPLSKYMQTELSYRDYLRLFMVLHGGGEAELARMLALIRLNTGIDPAGKCTYASAEIVMGLRLWFLPGVVQMVNAGAGLPGNVRDKVYYKQVRADYAY